MHMDEVGNLHWAGHEVVIPIFKRKSIHCDLLTISQESEWSLKGQSTPEHRVAFPQAIYSVAAIIALPDWDPMLYAISTSPVISYRPAVTVGQVLYYTLIQRRLSVSHTYNLISQFWSLWTVGFPPSLLPLYLAESTHTDRLDDYLSTLQPINVADRGVLRALYSLKYPGDIFTCVRRGALFLLCFNMRTLHVHSQKPVCSRQPNRS